MHLEEVSLSDACPDPIGIGGEEAGV